MARDPLNRAFAPTTPDDLLDPPRFGQVTETTKDVLVLELRKFLSNAQQTNERRIELPTIEKYATFGDGNDPYATAVSILRKYPDKIEELPHVAVMASTGAERRLNIGPPFVATVQDPAFVQATIAEPYALTDGDVLTLRTFSPKHGPALDTIVFATSRFPSAHPITAALAKDVARVINEQAAYVRATVIEDSGQNYVRIEAGGSNNLGQTPSEIEVHSTSLNAHQVLGLGRQGSATNITVGTPPTMLLTAPAGTWTSADIGRYIYLRGTTLPYFNDGRFLITAFTTNGITDTLSIDSKYGREELSTPGSWFIGLRDDCTNIQRPPKHRYVIAADLNVQIDVITEDENTRGELVDLIFSFFSFFLEQKYFTFLGRSGFSEQETMNEYYQIVINPPIRNASEAEFPRPTGDGSGKVYVNSFALEVTVTMYIDREVYWPGTNTPAIATNKSTTMDTTLLPDC